MARLKRKFIPIPIGTFPTSGSISAYVLMGHGGTVKAVYFGATTGLAAHDTNYWTFSITNLGTGGVGTTAMLAATAANTTKVTGGAALVANGRFAATVHGTAANLDFVAGDTLQVTVTCSTGSIANTGTFGRCTIDYDQDL